MILWNIKRRLSSISRRATPDRDFIIALGKTLKDKGYVRTSRFQGVMFSWKRAATVLSLLGGLLVGTGTYAYVSPEVLPDSPLYGLRSTIEKVEFKVARTPAAKEKIQLKHLRRHLQEQQKLADRNYALALAHTEVLVRDLSETVKSMDRLEIPSQDEADEENMKAEEEAEARAMVAMDQEVLAELANDHKELTEDEVKIFHRVLRDQVKRTDEHVESLQELRRRDQQPNLIKRILRTQ